MSHRTNRPVNPYTHTQAFAPTYTLASLRAPLAPAPSRPRSPAPTRVSAYHAECPYGTGWKPRVTK